MSDERLVERFVGGEERAFERLVARYRDRVYQFVRWYLDAGAVTADDLAQTVFLELYRSAHRFGHRARFRTWLYALARNVCRSHARRRWWRAGGRSDLDRLEIVDQGPGPLENLETLEQGRLLRRAVTRLPPGQRAVLLLREWEDLSYREIARVLRLPIGTVRSRLYNARQTLARRLAPQFERDDHEL